MNRCPLATLTSSWTCGMHLWCTTMMPSPSSTTYDAIDATPISGALWQCAALSYNGSHPESPLIWMDAEYTIWYQNLCLLFRNMLENPDFSGSVYYVLYWQFDAKGSCQYEHFMSGDLAWNQAVRIYFLWYQSANKTQNIIAKDPETHGSMFVPIILGSNKTTVFVATGHVEYWPLYGSIGNIHNNIWHAHGAGLVLISFLSIAKSVYCIYYLCDMAWVQE